jgi:hypothetical protein
MSFVGIRLLLVKDFMRFPTTNRRFLSLNAEIVNAVLQDCFDFVICRLGPTDLFLAFVENRYDRFL